MAMRLIESMVCILAQRNRYVKPTLGIRTFAPVPIKMTTDAVILRLANRTTQHRLCNQQTGCGRHSNPLELQVKQIPFPLFCVVRSRLWCPG